MFLDHKKWVAGKWHRPFASADITHLVLVTKLFGWYLVNHSIIFMTDNSGVVEIVNQISSRNQQTMILVRMLVLACLEYNNVFR